jgi:hypothetical protein
MAGEIAGRFLAAVLAQPKVKALLSSEHFSVDGTLLEAWAGLQSFRPKDGSSPPADPGRNGEQDFHSQRRSNGVRRKFRVCGSPKRIRCIAERSWNFSRRDNKNSGPREVMRRSIQAQSQGETYSAPLFWTVRSRNTSAGLCRLT